MYKPAALAMCKRAAHTVEFALQWEHRCGRGVNRAAKKPAPRGRRRRPVFLHACLRHPHPFGTTAVVVVRGLSGGQLRVAARAEMTRGKPAHLGA
jgi:hypothetical protein